MNTTVNIRRKFYLNPKCDKIHKRTHLKPEKKTCLIHELIDFLLRRTICLNSQALASQYGCLLMNLENMAKAAPGLSDGTMWPEPCRSSWSVSKNSLLPSNVKADTTSWKLSWSQTALPWQWWRQCCQTLWRSLPPVDRPYLHTATDVSLPPPVPWRQSPNTKSCTFSIMEVFRRTFCCSAGHPTTAEKGSNTTHNVFFPSFQ